MKTFITLSILCLLAPMLIMAQQKITISGTITDHSNGELLISANVYEKESLQGTISNYYGFYSLKLPKGENTIVYSYLGYNTKTLKLNLTQDTVLNIQLKPSLELEEVVIESDAPIRNVRSTQMSMVELPIKSIQTLPVLFGEVDVIKSLQLTPGVQGGTEGTSGLYVRGGSLDQNLILLDGVPVYNVNHLFGIFSVFNADAIKSVSLYKGGFPARFGGRLSSVVDLRMKEGNMQEFKGSGGIGLLSSSLTFEGPIQKDKTSFIISGRRTYFDLLTYPFQIALNNQYDDGHSWVGYYFYDLNLKVNHIINDRNRIYFSNYLGSDNFYLKDKYESDDNFYTGPQGEPVSSYYQYDDEIGLRWGNITSALRWNSIINQELFLNTTATYSTYKFKTYVEAYYEEIYDTIYEENNYEYEYFSQIQDFSLKADLDYRPNAWNYFRFGISNTVHLFSPGVTVEWENSDEFSSGIDTTIGIKNFPTNEMSMYFEDEINIGLRFKMNAGIHYSNFFTENTWYHSFEPRFSARYMLTDNISYKISYVQMKQYLNLLANSGFSLPTDLWVPATNDVKPQKAWQIASGFSWAIQNKYELTLEGYYKRMRHLIEYEEGASFFELQGDWQDIITQGKGESYGGEIMVNKSTGKTTGWIGYALAWSHRAFDEISFGRTFPFKYDRRHQFNFVITHSFNERIDAGASWQYGSGYPITLANEEFLSFDYTSNLRYNIVRHPGLTVDNETYTEYFKTRNNYRLPDYHRLDFGIHFHKQKKRYERTWSFGAYNVYSRQNPLFVYQSEEYNESTREWEPVLKQVSFLPILPYFRWSFKF